MKTYLQILQLHAKVKDISYPNNLIKKDVKLPTVLWNRSLSSSTSTDDLGFTAPPVPVKPSPPEQITTLEKGSIRITSANNTNRHRRNSIVGQGTESLPSNVASLPEKFEII